MLLGGGVPLFCAPSVVISCVRGPRLAGTAGVITGGTTAGNAGGAAAGTTTGTIAGNAAATAAGTTSGTTRQSTMRMSYGSRFMLAAAAEAVMFCPLGNSSSWTPSGSL